MKKITIILILFVLFVSISAVSAEGNFTTLQNEINSSPGGINLTQNYVYNNATDSELAGGIVINKTNFTINGNGFTIDGANQARIFDICSNVTISNLKIINANRSEKSGGSIYSNQSLIINNVTFTQNTAKWGGAIYSTESITISNSTFTQNTATKCGGAIYSEKSMTIINSTFTQNFAKWSGGIYAEKEINISNSFFFNSTSTYATAIYIKNGKGRIKNCDFVNLTATMTAGAIGIKPLSEEIIIEDCNFINISSQKNGGAVFADVLGMDRTTNGYIGILNSRFINCYSEFGGAYVQLGGNLTIENSTFTNNCALYDGGAIYLSYTKTIIKNSEINENLLKTESSNGGALYSDYSMTYIENSRIENNTKQGIYAYDGGLIVKNTTFSNNGEAIHGVFIKYNLENNEFENDTKFLNDTYYINALRSTGLEITFINNTIDVENPPSKYDLRDWGWVSSLKDQGEMGACWTLAIIGALESSLLKTTGTEYDFSENNMQNIMLQYSKYGEIGLEEGGSIYQGIGYLISWLGPIPEKEDTYDELGKLSPLITSNETIHIQDAISIGSLENLKDNDKIKKTILTYGALPACYYHSYNDSFFNEETAAYYTNTTEQGNHDISVIGWDDNYPKENFIITPPGDGAWIIKSNWGNKYGKNGYYYISYYEKTLFRDDEAFQIIFKNNENYTTNYQTDLGGQYGYCTKNGTILRYKNTYQSLGNELISGVGTLFNENENYTLEIYVNGNLKHTQSGIAPFRGYHTVKLTKEIPITSGDTFTALMTKNSVPIIVYSRLHYKENVSFVDDGDGWEDFALYNYTACLKVYTKDLTIYTDDLVKIYKNESQFKAIIGAANETVTFEINGMNYTRTTNENGTAKLNINLGPGNYTIKTTYNNITVENSIEVLPTLIGNNLVKYFRNESQFYVTLIDGAGKPVSDANITMNINGVFYNRKTNENGTAKLNINLDAGEYILTATDPLTGLQMSYNITVLSLLNATDLEMTYMDGSTFNVTAVDGRGKAIANATVTFNINGVFYTRYTDSNGNAKLNIRLMPGKYIITSEYENCRIANTITIKD